MKMSLTIQSRYWVFKQVSIAFFAICVFLFGNNAFAVTVDTQQEAYNNAVNLVQNHTPCQSEDCYYQFFSNGPNSIIYRVYRQSGSQIQYYVAPRDPANFDQNTGEPLSQEPDISECTATQAEFHYGTRQPDGSIEYGEFQTEINIDGCTYPVDLSEPVQSCQSYPNSESPEEIYCTVDLEPATETYDPSTQPNTETEPGGDTGTSNPETPSTPQQDNTSDNLSDWFGSEPTETFDYPDGSKFRRWESSTGCTLEVIVQPDGSYQEITDTCNVHTPSSGTVSPDTPPQWEPEQNHTNPDGSPNPGGGSGDNSPSGGGGDTGGGDTGGGDTGGGDTGGGDTGGGDTGGGDTGGGDTGGGDTGGGDGESGGECDPASEFCDPFVAPDGTELYTPTDKTFESVISDFQSRIQAAPFYSAATGFFDVNITATCPIWTLPGVMGLPSITIDQQCSPMLNNALAIVSAIIIATAGFVAFRWAFL
jgi:hypothetical protein